MRTQIDTLMDDYRAVVAGLDGLTADVAALTATARSADRCVTATVGPRGELVQLTIDPVLAARIDTTTLAGRVVEATTRAAAVVRERVRTTICDALPGYLRDLVAADGEVSLGRLLPNDLHASVADNR